MFNKIRFHVRIFFTVYSHTKRYRLSNYRSIIIDYHYFQITFLNYSLSLSLTGIFMLSIIVIANCDFWIIDYRYPQIIFSIYRLSFLLTEIFISTIIVIANVIFFIDAHHYIVQCDCELFVKLYEPSYTTKVQINAAFV